MIPPPRQKLTLAELLIVLALVGVALGLARRWWDGWKAEEWTLAAAWTTAWILGVIGGRAVFYRAVLPATLLCMVAAAGIALYFKLSWTALLIVVGAALTAALVTAALPWAVARSASFLATAFFGRSRASLISVAGFAMVILAATGAALAFVWFRTPPVSTTVLRQFEKASDESASERRDFRCVSSGGRYVALSSEQGIEVLDIESGAARVVPNSSELEAITISPGGRRLGCFQRDLNDERKATALCVDTVTGAHLVAAQVTFSSFTLALPDDTTFLLGTLSAGRTRLEVERWRLDPQVEVIDRWQFECPENGSLGALSKDGRHGVVDYDDGDSPISTIVRWQIWQIAPPAELITDSEDQEVPPAGPGFLANGEWFANASGFWNRSLSTQIEIDGTVLGIDPASRYLAVLRYNGNAGPPFPRIGLSDELMEQLPYWRLLNNPAEEVQLWLYDLRDPARIWQSPAVAVRAWTHWNQAVFDMEAAPDGSAIALQDDTGKIILWRIHRSPFDDR